MQISKLYIQNFRGTEKRNINLNPRFTVIVGNNGTGKSTLLYALQIAAGTFFLGLPKVNRRHINEDEIRFEINAESKAIRYFSPTIVEASGHINGSCEFTWRRERSNERKHTSEKPTHVGQIRDIAATYSWSLHSKNRSMLPVIVFFGIKQLEGKPSARRRMKKNREIIKDGYYNAFGMQNNQAIYTQWFYYYKESLTNDLEFSGTDEAVIVAIETAMPYLKNVAFDNFRLELVADCEIEGQKAERLPHSLMSDGVKRMLGIVADIAYRCIVLNGFRGKEAVIESQGVVMIELIELYMHPKWQRHVVANIKAAFPKIQFVVTTHSPFVVQSLESDELINLDRVSDVTPKDLSIELVTHGIMGG